MIFDRFNEVRGPEISAQNKCPAEQSFGYDISFLPCVRKMEGRTADTDRNVEPVRTAARFIWPDNLVAKARARLIEHVRRSCMSWYLSGKRYTQEKEASERCDLVALSEA